MTSNWPENHDIQSVRDFSNWLALTSQHPERVYRGQAKSCWNLQPTLDRNVQETDSFEDRVRKEKDDIEFFCRQAHRFLGKLEQAHLEGPPNSINCMTVMQHFGAPTRLLDWTQSGAIAAYFACVDKDNLDGTVWWMNGVEVETWVGSRWDSWGYERRPDPENSPINLLDRFDDPKAPAFVSMTYLRIRFSRAQAQRGLFTFGSQPGMAHDVQLKEQLQDGSYRRVVIPAKLKTEVIEYLERMGIDAISLQHAGADRIGLRMKWDREHRNKT